MIERFLQWWASNSHRKIAVFGAGTDYQALCAAVPDLKEKLLCVIDENGAPGTVSLSAALSLAPDVIIPASLVYQENMRRKLVAAGYSGEIHFLYENDPEIGALGLLAHDPERDWPEPDKSTSSPSSFSPPSRISRILLIHPPFDVANHRHKKTMPMGLLYLGGMIRREFPDMTLTLLDAHIERLSWPEMKQRLDSLEFEMVLLSYWSAQAGNASLITRYLSSRNVWIVHGGVHASLCPESVEGSRQILVPYEGEKGVVQLLQDLNSEGLKAGLSYLFGNSRQEIVPDYCDDLDQIPFPAWDLLPDPARYDHPLHVVGGRRFPILGSRGCPFSCTFCSSPLFWKRRVRWRSPERVVDEMDTIAAQYGVPQFHFWDDNMVMNRKWIQELAEELIRRKCSYRWVGLSRASDIVKQNDLLPRLKEAGCIGMEIGVESFTDQVSETVAKGEHTESTRSAVQCLCNAGITPLYTHMLFTPGETIRSYREKEAFMTELNRSVGTAVRSDSPLGQLATPHVKTEFAREAGSHGMVLWRSPGDSYHHRVNFLPNSLLEDVPVHLNAEHSHHEEHEGCSDDQEIRPDALSSLAAIVQSVFDWTAPQMRSFIKVHDQLWKQVDGRLSVRKLAEMIAKSENLPIEQACMFTCLSVVFWARKGLIRGK